MLNGDIGDKNLAVLARFINITWVGSLMTGKFGWGTSDILSTLDMSIYNWCICKGRCISINDAYAKIVRLWPLIQKDNHACINCT